MKEKFIVSASAVENQSGGIWWSQKGENIIFLEQKQTSWLMNFLY